MKVLLLVLFVFFGQFGWSTEIRFQASLILANRDITSMDTGELLWQDDYRVTPGEEVLLTWRSKEEGFGSHDLVLTLDLPGDAKPGEQRVIVTAYWQTNEGIRELGGFGRMTQVTGQLDVTLFQHPQEGKSAQLRLLPEVIWPEEGFEHAKDIPLAPEPMVFALGKRLIGRTHQFQAATIWIADSKGSICRLSTDPSLGWDEIMVATTDGLKARHAGLELELITLGQNSSQIFVKWEPSRNRQNVTTDHLEVRTSPQN